MDRLTFDGNFCDIAQCCELPCQHGGSCSQRKVWERLKQYEDTRLTPNDVADMRDELCQLCGKYQQAHEGACDGCRWKGGSTDERPEQN